MAYSPYVWKDDPTGGTPITAARLNAIETGLGDAAGRADSAFAAAATTTSRALYAPIYADTVVLLQNGTFVGQLGYTGQGNKITYRWNGTKWRAWDSEFIDFTPTWVGFPGSVYQSPGWLPGGRYRYTAGKVRYEFAVLMNTDLTPSGISVNIPVAADQYGAFNSGTSSPLQDGFAVTGRAGRFNGSRYYDVAIRWASSTTLAFAVVNSAQYMDGIGGGAWAQSEKLFGVIEYDPA